MISAAPVLRPSAATFASGHTLVARVARHGVSGTPPMIFDVVADHTQGMIERLFEHVAREACLPVVAVREVIENLIHADFMGALVSILDNGETIRVADLGPGIANADLALEPGYTTATTQMRTFIRGVGCGLSLAKSVMETGGGRLSISDNLGRGAVITLHGAGDVSLREHRTPEISQEARLIMALLTEVGSAGVDTLAAELLLETSNCGRELVLLEHRGLVSRSADGSRGLTRRGSDLITSLF